LPNCDVWLPQIQSQSSSFQLILPGMKQRTRVAQSYLAADEAAVCWFRRSIETNRNVAPFVYFFRAAALAIWIGSKTRELRSRPGSPTIPTSRSPNSTPTRQRTIRPVSCNERGSQRVCAGQGFQTGELMSRWHAPMPSGCETDSPVGQITRRGEISSSPHAKNILLLFFRKLW
jgi:hypothetical protein